MAKIALKHVNSFVDRHGQQRHVCRVPGQKSFTLPGQPGSSEFMDAYQAALAKAPGAEIGAGRTVSGTINALVIAYYNTSAEFQGFAAETQSSRRTYIEAFRAEHGNLRAATLHRGHIQKMLAAMDRPHGRKNWLKAIRGLLRFAVSINMRVDDPTEGITCKLPKSDGYHTWTDDEIEQYRAHWPLGSQPRLALELALETTSRRADVTRIGPQHIRNGDIHIRHTKNRADVTIPVSPELQAAIDATPTAHLTFMHTQAGTAMAPRTLGGAFRKWCDEAGLAKRCTIHGLRKGGSRRLAEAGCTPHEIMAFTGHTTLAEVERYTKAVDGKRLAGQGAEKLAAQNRTSTYKPSSPRLQTGS